MVDKSLHKNLIDKACEIISNNGVIACPTETVYGLFGSALSDTAVQFIYKIKGRPSYNPLIVHVYDIDTIEQFCNIDNKQREILHKCWYVMQWPVTFVLHRNTTNNSMSISDFATAGLNTIAVRRPNNNIALQLLKQVKIPLVAPSANTSNCLSPTNARMVIDDIGSKVNIVLDGGQCSVGIESTIIDISSSHYRILRHGYVTNTMFYDAFGITLNKTENTDKKKCNIVAPGMLKKHYSPRLPMRLNAVSREDGEAFVSLGDLYANICTHNLSKNGDLIEAAKNMYFILKSIDDSNKYKSIAVAPIPELGIGIAINDRLTRGACNDV